MTSSDSHSPARRRIATALLVTIVACVSVWAINYVALGRPTHDALRADSRNDGIDLRAHYAYYLDPRTAVLDLERADDAAPADLFRSLFQVAAAMKDGSSRQIILARNGHPIFVMKGEDFRGMGQEFSNGENPLYLIRTLPEKLYKTSGDRAFGSWEGGWLGVLTHQINDANEAGRQWAVAESGP